MSRSEQKKILTAEKKELLNLIKDQQLEIKKLKDNYDKDIYTLNFIVQNLPGSVYWKNRKGVYLGYNDYAKDLMCTLGFSSVVIGKTDYDIFPKEVADNFRKSDLTVLSGKSLVKEEMTILPDFRKMIQLSSKIPLLDEAKKIVGILGISLDITERKQAERAKEEFITNMSHDLRTPLAGIIGVSHLQAQFGNSKQEREYGQMIEGAGNQLLELLNQVLKVASVEQETDQNLKKDRVNLEQLIDELHTLILPAVKDRGLELHLILDSELPIAVETDYMKLKRILLNLLANAVKFTNKGSVTLELHLTSLVNQRAEIEICIQDTGIGIPEDKLDKILDRFYRTHASFEGAYQGYGIGLYLVQKFVDLLKGEIKIISKEGEGSCFSLRFNFPVLKEKNITIQKAALPQSEFSTKKASSTKLLDQSVLVVEDDSLVSYVMKLFLEDLGYQVTTATTAKKALSYLQIQRFIWVLLDIGLPDMSGVELAKHYRSWEQEMKKKHLPIFILSAHMTGDIKHECIQVGIDAVFEKPFNEKHLQTIKNLLNK